MNITVGLLVIASYFIARMLVKRAKEAERAPSEAWARPDRSSDRDMIEPID